MTCLPPAHAPRRTFIQIASTFDAVYRVSAPRNTRLFLNDIDFDGWGDPYGSFGMGTLFALPHVRYGRCGVPPAAEG